MGTLTIGAAPSEFDTVSKTVSSIKTTSLFTISGGEVLISEIVGRVTTVIQTQANNVKLLLDPTVGSNTDLCAVLDVSADAAGSLYTITGTFADALINAANGADQAQATRIVCAPGVLKMNCSATNTGAIVWSCRWAPLTPGAVVTVA